VFDFAILSESSSAFDEISSSAFDEISSSAFDEISSSAYSTHPDNNRHILNPNYFY